MFLLIDNYDSFTYNLWHYLGELGAEVVVQRNDALSVAEALALKPAGHRHLARARAIPTTPASASSWCAAPASARCSASASAIRRSARRFGGRWCARRRRCTASVSAIHHDGSGVFAGLPNPLPATRYHSLIVERASLPAALARHRLTEDGLIMGLAHRERPIHGVQFHPESIASEGGHALLRNFLASPPAESVAA